MIKLINQVNDPTEWAGTVEEILENEYLHLIAGHGGSSLYFRFTEVDQIAEFVPDEPIDVTDYTEIVLHMCGLFDGMVAKIEIGEGNIFSVKVKSTLSWVKINIEDIDEIDVVRIMPTDTSQMFLVSYIVAVTPEYPLDILVGIKDALENIRDKKIKYKFLGTVGTEVDDEYITLDGEMLIAKYCVLKIESIEGVEYHQVEKIVGDQYYFNGNYDGSKILYEHVDATVHLFYPITYLIHEIESNMSGISVWTSISEQVNQESDIQVESHTFNEDGTSKENRVGVGQLFRMQIDAESFSYEILYKLAYVVRVLMSRGVVWVGGKKCIMQQEGMPVQQQFQDPNMIPKISVMGTVYLRDDSVHELKDLMKVNTTNFNVEEVKD